MRIFDTHCHLADPAFDADREQVIERLRAAGVCRANVVADPCEADARAELALQLVEAHDFLCVSAGVHPHHAARYDDGAEKALLKLLSRPDCALLGEIGLDYHYDFSPRADQLRAFDRQLELAWELKRPVQLHIREAHADTRALLGARAARGALPRGIVHCFTGDWADARFYLDCGLDISLSGALSFKNAPNLVEVAQKLPPERMLIETDCPYMAPVPLRGRRNEPAFIVHTLERAAAARGVSAPALAEILYRNSLRAFGLPEETGDIELGKP